MARRQSGSRSQRRLGTEYPSSSQRVRLSLAPVSGRWQAHASRLTALLLLAVLGWVIYAIFDSSRFYVYGAEVEGNTVVTPAEVYTASGMEGLSVFWVDPTAIAARVETLPNVRSAQVRVELPARAIITVEERQPELVWQTGDTLWWVDAEGTILPPRAVLTNTLTIIDADAQVVTSGQVLNSSVVEAAIALRQLLPDLSVMRYSQATGISFQTREGWPVYLGDAQNMDAKLTILVALYKDLLARGVSPQFIDVRFVERPFYK